MLAYFILNLKINKQCIKLNLASFFIINQKSYKTSVKNFQHKNIY